MKYYFAPLEGITNVYFREAFDKHYGKIDKYYIPFLSPTDHTLGTKDLRETNPEANHLNGMVVPQIISKNSDDTIWFINYLKEKGYEEVNLNFGCPSATIVPKGKGAGMLKNTELMNQYLKEVFAGTNSKISIKLRLGVTDANEFDRILEIINKYPVEELIIHPRTASEQYQGKLHFDILEHVFNKTEKDIIYNGEIKSRADIDYITRRFPKIKGVMIGRGLLEYPDLLEEEVPEKEKIRKLKEYYEDFSRKNIKIFGFGSSKFFHKQIWSYLVHYFDIPKQLSKKLFKANKQEEFEAITEEIFESCPISKNREKIEDYE